MLGPESVTVGVTALTVTDCEAEPLNKLALSLAVTLTIEAMGVLSVKTPWSKVTVKLPVSVVEFHA